MPIIGGNHNQYKCIVFCMPFLFEAFIDPHGRVNWDDLSPERIEEIIDGVNLTINFDAIPITSLFGAGQEDDE